MSFVKKIFFCCKNMDVLKENEYKNVIILNNVRKKNKNLFHTASE